MDGEFQSLASQTANAEAVDRGDDSDVCCGVDEQDVSVDLIETHVGEVGL
jgi:hypothetical protein